MESLSPLRPPKGAADTEAEAYILGIWFASSADVESKYALRGENVELEESDGTVVGSTVLVCAVGKLVLSLPRLENCLLAPWSLDYGCSGLTGESRFVIESVKAVLEAPSCDTS